MKLCWTLLKVLSSFKVAVNTREEWVLRKVKLQSNFTAKPCQIKPSFKNHLFFSGKTGNELYQTSKFPPLNRSNFLVVNTHV